MSVWINYDFVKPLWIYLVENTNTLKKYIKGTKAASPTKKKKKILKYIGYLISFGEDD